ncbi:MAG: hypothetical protein SXV54_09015 [Chloroflexota bacterium]|nr:hypothetical protein [Chloroflexota bacterium]
MKARTFLYLTLPFWGAIAALTMMLSTISWARDALPADSPAPPPVPLARPHDPSSGVYTMYDTLTPSDLPSVTYQWVEIRDSADYAWNLGGYGGHSDVSAPYPIGFFFPFYDDFYTHFRISEKGYIFFERQGVNVGSGRGRPDLIPSSNLTGTDAANNFIAPFAAHLYGYPEFSRVYVRSDSNPRRTIIEFENVVWCCGRYNPRTFQIILHPSGDIEMQYLKIANFAGTLDQDLQRTVIVGLENLDGSAGDVYTQGLFIPDATDFWQDGMAIRFRPNFTGAQAVFLPSSGALWDDPGRLITTTSHLYLGASEEITRGFSLTHSLLVSSSVPRADWESGIIYPPSIAAITGTCSSTLPIVVSVPLTVTNFDDMAIVTFTAESVDATPFISATFTLRYGPAHRDLQVAKTLHPDVSPSEGGAFRYRLVVTNTDYDDSSRAAIARGVVVTDLLPPGITYEDCRRTYWWHGCGSLVTTGTIGSRTIITLNLGTMYADEIETAWLELRNTGNVLGSVVSNTAHVTTTQSVELGDGPNNHSAITFTVAAAATELAIYKDYPYDDDFVAAGQAIPYNIEFYNNGSDDHLGNGPLYDATIVDLLPENTTFHRAELYYSGPELVPGAGGLITPAISGPMSRTLTFTIPFVDNGWWNYANLRVWVNIPPTVPIGTSLNNVVTISHGADEASFSEAVKVASSYVDPFVDKEPSRDEQGNVILPGPGQDYIYWINYGNRSVLSRVPNVIITDTLPPSVTLVSVSAARYLSGPVTSTLPGGIVQLTWYTDTGPGIPQAWMGQIALVVRINDDVRRGTRLANHIAITYTGAYTPSTTADDTDVVTIEVASDLEHSQKLVDDPTPSAGESVEYTLVVSNASLSNTISFTVSDVLPAGLLTYVSHYTPTTGTVTVKPNAILWAGEVISSSAVTLTFQATVTEVAYIGQIIRNTAYITGGGASLERWRDVTVARGVFGDSEKTASTGAVASGDTFTYTITARNNGSASRVVTVTDSVHPSVTLVSSSFDPTTGTAVFPPNGDGRAFTWTIGVDGLGSESLSFHVTVTDGLTNGVTIENIAYLDDGFSPDPIPLTATVTIYNPAHTVYLPLVLENWRP